LAAITPTAFSPYKVLKDVAAEAAGTSTFWFDVPEWVKSVLVTYNFTAAAAGTGHSVVVTVRAADPVSRDDTNDHGVLETSATITAVSFHHYALAPTFTTAGTDSATADSSRVVNAPIPSVLGVRIANAAGTGATYTYTLTVRFKG
jgi:hypothetical protein